MDEEFEGGLHVVPANDIEQHTLTMNCLCCPKIERYATLLIIHNAFDKREQIEVLTTNNLSNN